MRNVKAIFYHGFKSTISHIHTHLPTPFLISHYWWVEDVERVGHTFISWYAMWSQHKLDDFYDLVTLLHLFFVSWFKKKKINLTLRRLQMCSEATKLIFESQNVYVSLL